MSFFPMESTDYQSFLLRLWRDGPDRAWRGSVHCATTDVRLNFADTDQLFAFLQNCMDGTKGAKGQASEGDKLR